MANTNQTTTSIPDLFSKLSAFLTPLGWTVDEAPTVDRFSIRKTDNGNVLYNQFRWEAASPNIVAIYASTGFTAMNDPGAHPGDDGQGSTDGSTNAALDNYRHVALTATPIQFWAYADGTNDYCHVVVQTSSTQYVHFGFGLLEKFNDWTGGEYCYGSFNGSQSALSDGTQRGDFLTYLLDGRATWHNNISVGAITELAAFRAMPTIRVADSNSFPQPSGATSDWAVVAGLRHPFTGDVGDDRAGNQRKRCFGGFRDGYGATNFGRFAGRSIDGVVPLYEIPIIYTNGETGSGTINYFLGSMRDVRGVNMGFFQNEQIVTIGGESWQLFTVEPRATVAGSYGGVAYRVF
jgi:hypothetical protein